MEREIERTPDVQSAKKLQESARKYMEEIAELKKRRNSEMREAVLLSTEKKQREKIDSYFQNALFL